MKLFILLFTLISLSFAQTTDFSVTIHKPFDAALFDIKENYDRTITAVGFSNEFKQKNNPSKEYTDAFDYLASLSTKYGPQMNLVKIDNQAKIVLQKSIKLDSFNKAVSLVKTPTDGYIVGGYTNQGSLFVVKLDSSGNTLYKKTFGTKNFNKMHKLLSLGDGGLLAIGSSFTSRSNSDNIFQTGIGNNDIFITRFSKNGNILWSKKYGTPFDDNGVDAAEGEDGSLIVVSTTTSQKEKEVTFMRLTENGDTIWINHFIKRSGNNFVLPKRVIRLHNNTFLISLIEYNQMHKEHIRLVKIDLYNTVLEDKKIETTYPSALLDIKEFTNGTIAGIGYVQDRQNRDALAMLLNKDLSMQKQEHYGKENFDIFYALEILHNSQIAAVGVQTDNTSQEKKMWIVKLNQDLTIAQTSIKREKIYAMLCKLFSKEIEQKEISIKKDLTIEFAKNRLLFKPNEYKLTKKQKRFLSKITKKLINFLYANKEYIQAIQINGHSSSEWRGVNFTKRYLNNEKLSMKRSFSVLKELFTKQTEKRQKWLSKILQGSGAGFSKTLYSHGIENREKSRRVTIKIVLTNN